MPAGAGSRSGESGRNWLGRGRGGKGGGRKAGGSGKKTKPRSRVVTLLTGSARFTVLRTVGAIISCRPDNSLRAGCYCRAADGGPEARRGGGRQAAAPCRAVPSPCPPPRCELACPPLPTPRVISRRQGARRRQARCHGISGVSQVPGKHTNRPV